MRRIVVALGVVLTACACIQAGATEVSDTFQATKAKAKKGDPEAQYKLGIFYNGTGAAQDHETAITWFRKAAEQNNANAEFKLGACYAQGVGVAKNAAEAVKWYRKSAEQNLAEAQYTLGKCYHYASGVTRDETEAVKWFRKAAEQNDAEAQLALGSCYFNGEGVAKDAASAVNWYRRAAEQNLATAQYFLGRCYQGGDGISKEMSQAAAWFRKAAEQNDAEAQCSLGICYRIGNGVTKDLDQAVKWLRLAAVQNLARAQYNLGLCYENGDGVLKDIAQAVQWYRKAAEQNDAAAQFRLGLCYENGDGVAKDMTQTIKWYRKAADQSHLMAMVSLRRLEKQTNAVQVADGKRLSREPGQIQTPEPESRVSKDGSETLLPSGSGTGFFVTRDGFVVTCAHVVKSAVQIRVVTGAAVLQAELVKKDVTNDLALLKVDGSFAPLPVTSDHFAQPGDPAATVGFPTPPLQGWPGLGPLGVQQQRFAPQLTKGKIAALSGLRDESGRLQISAPVQPGNSGGALVDEHGNVIGVAAAKLNKHEMETSGALPENVTYAVKSDLLLTFLESVPDVAAKLQTPITKPRKFQDVAQSTEQATVLVLVY